MNIFDLYLIKIKDILKDLSKQNKIILHQNLEGITAEIPPVKFDSDISTNVAMFLAKINKKTPNDIAEILSPILSDNDEQIERISIAKVGFDQAENAPSKIFAINQPSNHPPILGQVNSYAGSQSFPSCAGSERTSLLC